MIPHRVTVAVMAEVVGLPKAEQVEALDRARQWAWWMSLKGRDRDERRDWQETTQQIKGAGIAVRMGA